MSDVDAKLKAAWKVYRKAIASAWKVYEKAVVPALEDYEKARKERRK